VRIASVKQGMSEDVGDSMKRRSSVRVDVSEGWRASNYQMIAFLSSSVFALTLLAEPELLQCFL
jgi:hypothetical protein